MATILWNQAIDKTVDWAGDASTGGAPVSGKYVQQFIKDTLAKKFGYMYYDRNNLKYLVFADEDDYNTYSLDPTNNASLLLAQFDAPAPASISIYNPSNYNVTTLLNATGRKITFNYYIIDSSNRPVAENVSMRVVFARGGETESFTRIVETDSKNYSKDPSKSEDGTGGTNVEVELDDYLREEGTYTITITLTGLNTQATTTLTYFYTIVNLNLSLENFKYYIPFDSNESSFEISFTATGAARIAKTMEVFIDGEELFQKDLGYRKSFSSGDSIGTAASITDYLTLYNKDINGNLVKWGESVKNTDLLNKTIFSPGKHSIQLRISIPGDTTGSAFYSKTKYFDFVVVDSSSSEEPTYLLYATETEPGTVFDVNSNIQIVGQQYTPISLSVAVVDVANRKTDVKYTITSPNGTVETQHNVNNQSIDPFEYIFDTPDDYVLTVSDGFTNTVQITADIKINSFNTNGETIEEQDQSNLLVKYTALNRSNTEVNRDVWKNSAINFADVNPYPVKFNNILWNDQSGWNGEALVLKNGANIEIPVNLFNLFGALGLTFEIDFETFDVQNDDAVIMDYSDPSPVNTSYIKITATSATLNSRKNVSLKTNFKDNTRNKIAFTFNPTAEVIGGESQGNGNPNLLFIYVNGVLDRAAKWGNGSVDSDDVYWTAPTTQSIVIGNTNGEAGVKIYSIRIYRSSLLPEQAFMNYVVDQGKNIPAIINKNHVLDESGNVSFDLVKQLIPTLLISMDFTALNNQTNKKSNTQYAMQYFDPKQPELNFYVRNGWISCQGTSSMQYPTKNLRPYFNKQRNDKTFDFGIASSSQAAELTAAGIDVKANFNTEFWPVSEYAGHEDEVSTYVDTAGIVPYSVNKKEIVKGKEFANNYHEIGQGKSNAYKIDLAIKYALKTEVYWKNGTATIVVDNKSKVVDHYEIITATEDQTVAERITEIITNGNPIYISAYRPLRRTGWELDSEEYWIYIKQLRYSGVAIFNREVVSDNNGNILGINYNKQKKLKKGVEYYSLGAYWRQYDEPLHYSGWTDRWTLKTDYAESSMCHNSGIGRLWGNALRNLKVNGVSVGLTQAQAASNDPYYIDIRTSCDGKPVVVFVKNPTGYDANGNIVYGAAEFAGLYNIMTDKSSTPLFGFEDIKDENNNYLFIANASLEDDKSKIPAGQENNKVQCWEFLQNGSLIGTGNSLAFDDSASTTFDKATMVVSDGEDLGLNIGEGRPIFTDFEPRWPESGEAYHEGDMNFCQDDVFGVESNSFETFWNWVAFTKPAVNYQINASTDSPLDGYDFSPYIAFATTAEAAEYRERTGDIVYLQWLNAGNIAYCAEGEKYRTDPNDKNTEVTFEFDPNIEGQPLYRLSHDINYEDVKKTINNTKIGDVWGSDVYEVPVYGFDASNRFIGEDGSIDQDAASDYLVTVYMKRNGNRYRYTNSYGQEVEYPNSSEIDAEDFKKASDGTSYANKTFMQFFSATKYDHLDVYKVAAYYVYVLRFGAVDQVVKNCMMTTEDGQHWYFINYDNDTTLGVRNDAQLIFNWDFDRDTYDYSGNSYAFAGAKSVFWNNLTMDEDFMNIVKAVDAVMYSSGLLSAKAVLEYLDEKQMNTWCERLYNEQEEIKYLSTFKHNFETDKFLLFMQGTRSSHRNWWVNHRWELYDAMWSNGSYADKKIKYYEVVTDASNSNEVDLFAVTAASKYYFTTQKNNKTIRNGFVELKSGESASFTTRENIAIGDPMVFIGPHKLKVLNFRPGCRYLSATLSLNEAYDITASDGITKTRTTWVKEGGTMMSKLLIGNGVNNCPVTNISGLNDISSLEEIDIRKCNMLTTSPSVNKLSNLHIFRAGGSTCTIFEPANGVSLYEVSLPSDNATASGEVYVLDESGNPIPMKNADGSIMEDSEGNIIYQTERVDRIYALQTLTLNNVIFSASPTEYVQYQSGENGDGLPYSFDAEGHLTGDYTDEKAYKYTLPDANGKRAIFDVQPTTKLSSVVFNNVTGLDTMKFVFDWKDRIIASGESLSSRVLTLTNINWENIKVSDLIEFVKGKKADGSNAATFNITEFTGTVKVISDNGDSTITIDEYNRIIEFFGEKAFTPGNAIYITCADGIFYQPTANTKQVILTSFSDTASYNTVSAIKPVYELVRGDRFTVKATIFPNDGSKYVYALTLINRGNAMPITPSDSYVYSHGSTGATLVNNADGTATLTFNEGASYSENIFAITVCKLNDNGTVNYNSSMIYQKDYNIYIGTKQRIVPTASEIRINIDDNTTSTTSFNITDENEHIVKFTLPTNVNASVKSVSVELDNNDYIELINIDNDNFTIEGNVISVKMSGIIPAEAVSFKATFRLAFDTTDVNKANVDKPLDITITPIYPTQIKFYTGEDFTTLVDNSTEFKINQSGEYKFKVVVEPSNYNVGISELTLDDFTSLGQQYNQVQISDVEDNIFTVKITNSDYKSFARKDVITITLFNKFDTDKVSPVTNDITIETFIVYPEETYLTIQDYNNDASNYVRTNNADIKSEVGKANSVDIYVLNGQGTVKGELETFTKLIPNSSSEYINAKIAVNPKSMYDADGSLELYEPTEAFSININNDITIESADASQVESSNVAVNVIAGENGNDTLAIKINANTNVITSVTVKGTYSVNYDVDRNAETDNAINKVIPFTITVYYTLASKTTYKKLDPNEYYLVDENSNYYLVELDSNKQLVQDSANRISRALALGTKFAGLGWITVNNTNIIPHFMALVEDVDGVYRNHNAITRDNRESSALYKFYPSAAMEGIYNKSEYSYQNDPDIIFQGLNNTIYWESVLSQASDYANSNFSKIYNLYSRDVNNVVTYIPTVKELEDFIGMNTDKYLNVDAIIDFINTNVNYNGVSLLKISSLLIDVPPAESSNATYFADLVYELDREVYEKMLYIVTSTGFITNASNSQEMFRVYVDVDGGLIDTHNPVRAMTITASGKYVETNASTILPFIVVS